jgi:uncharacterized membrane protein
MSRNKEDNTVEVVQRAIKYHRIRVTKATIRETLKTHPHYPSLLSVCEAFNEWKVENYPLKFNEDEILSLSPPFIIHFKDRNGQLAFVFGMKDNKISFYESYRKSIILEARSFIQKCSGAVILLNPDKDSGEKEFSRKRQDELLGNAVIPVVLLTILLITGSSVMNFFNSNPVIPDLRTILLILTKSLGIALSLLLVLHEFDLHNAFTDKLCHISKATSCNSVLHDRAARIFSWFGWADIGLIYFTGGIVLLPHCIDLQDYSYLSLLAAVALPYPVFSVIYQGLVLKKWCPLCLGVQVLLIIEFVILLTGLTQLHFSFESTRVFISTFLLTGLVYILLILYYREKKDKEMTQIKYGTLKFNPAVVNALLMNQKNYNIPVTRQSLLFGRKDAELLVTAFLSLHCSHCARAFQSLRELVKSDKMLRINLVIVTQDKAILNTLYHLNGSGEEDKILELLERWYNSDSFSRQSFSEEYCIPDVEDISEEVSNENLKLFKECGVIGTPTFFINGFQLPRQYSLNDIRHISKYINKKELEIQR